MNDRAGAQISTKAFLQSLVILFVLMLAAGTLTRVLPAGSYTRFLQDGREMIDPESFSLVARPDYPIWRWFTAPIEVLWGPDGLTIITILIFLLMVGASFAVLEQSGILRVALGRIVRAFGGRKYALLLVVSFFFMAVGAFFGIFEEIVPLVPLMIGLSYFLGWDSFVGLGMSILATNLGFSAAVTNPFTIGVAQKIAGLPLFSGAWFRIIIFIVVYAVLAIFLTRYAKMIDRDPTRSAVYREDQAERHKFEAGHAMTDLAVENRRLGKALIWFGAFVVLILLVLVSGPVLPGVSDYALPIVGLCFLVGGMGAGIISGESAGKVGKSALGGIAGIAPGIPLILMAASIKLIVSNGGIMDTLLHQASGTFLHASPFGAVLIVYLLALLIEFFIGSGSAKAFLLMPVLLPLADLVGLTRQVAVTAYCFGDGFSNLAYPTNPVLLISLGLTVVSYPRWLRWTAKLWLWLMAVTIVFLGIAVAIRFGPF